MKKVLLVEDDQLLGQEISQALERKELPCVWSKSIAEATEALTTEPIGLVLLDVMLSNQESGLTILKHIRTTAPLREIPVIMLTNAAPIDDINRAMELGAEDYMVKANTDMEKIVEIVKNRLYLH